MMVARKRLVMLVVAAASIAMLLGQSGSAAASAKPSMRAWAWDLETKGNAVPTDYAVKPGKTLFSCTTSPPKEVWAFISYKNMPKGASIVETWTFNGVRFYTDKQKWNKPKKGKYAIGVITESTFSDGLYKVTVKVQGKKRLSSSVTLATVECD